MSNLACFHITNLPVDHLHGSSLMFTKYTSSTYIHLQHIYMSNIYTSSTYIYIYTVYIEHIYSKNTMLLIKWTYIWSCYLLMGLKLINFQNDLIFWPLWGPEILFVIIVCRFVFSEKYVSGNVCFDVNYVICLIV